MTMSKTPITDARKAAQDIRSACGVLAILMIDNSMTDADVAAGLKFILQRLEPLEAALPVVAAPSINLPVLTLGDVVTRAQLRTATQPARRARPALSCIQGGAA